MALVTQRAYPKLRVLRIAEGHKAITAGRSHTAADGKIDVAKADAEWERNTGPRPRTGTAHSSPPPPNAASAAASDSVAGGLDYSRARAVRESYMARLAKIDFEERSGKLVNRDEVQVAAFNRFRTFRDGMLNIPDRVSAMVAAESDATAVHAVLTVEIRKALLEFADGAIS